jgi:hypothetical protein
MELQSIFVLYFYMLFSCYMFRSILAVLKENVLPGDGPDEPKLVVKYYATIIYANSL